MTDYVEYKPPADGVAPRGWQEGMVSENRHKEDSSWHESYPLWDILHLYRVPPAALHYPIVPYEGDWGADIAVNGRPEWLPDGQVFGVFNNGCVERIGTARIWNWKTIPQIRLPASHGYYADKIAFNLTDETFDLETWLSETKANLPAIEAAGHSVMFAPDWAGLLAAELLDIFVNFSPGVATGKAEQIIRSRVRPVL